MGDFWSIVGAIVLINVGWWLIYAWFLTPHLGRLTGELDAAWDRLEGLVMRLQEERDAALAEVERLKAENDNLWTILIRPCHRMWLVCTTATTYKPDEAEARAFVLSEAERLKEEMVEVWWDKGEGTDG